MMIGCARQRLASGVPSSLDRRAQSAHVGAATTFVDNPVGLDGSLRVSFLGDSRPLPSVLEVSVTTAAGLHVDARVAPTYRLVQPNGPGCAPICRQARIELIAR